jgi:hypothetical protein
MPQEFIDSFNKGLDDVERVTSGMFTVDGTEYRAISIDKLSMADRAMPGGKFEDVHTVMHIRVYIAQRAGLKNGTRLSAYDEQLRVIAIEKDGDDSWTVLCGPAGVEVPRLR